MHTVSPTLTGFKTWAVHAGLLSLANNPAAASLAGMSSKPGPQQADVSAYTVLLTEADALHSWSSHDESQEQQVLPSHHPFNPSPSFLHSEVDHEHGICSCPEAPAVPMQALAASPDLCSTPTSLACLR